MASHEFVLLIKSRDSGDRDSGNKEFEVMPVPSSPSSPLGKGITLEPVEFQRRQYLLMLQDGDTPGQNILRHNGQPAWPVTLLRVKDEVRTPAGTFFVSSRRGRSVFPPEERHLGVECPLCTLAFEKDTLVFACGSCGALLHCEDEGRPEDQRLECARMLSACPNCHEPIDFGTGLEWEPEP